MNIYSGEYASASNSSNQVTFLVINGGKLNIIGNNSNYVNVLKSGSPASSGQVSDDYNFYESIPALSLQVLLRAQQLSMQTFLRMAD